jgi:hypothetical protein
MHVLVYYHIPFTILDKSLSRNKSILLVKESVLRDGAESQRAACDRAER